MNTAKVTGLRGIELGVTNLDRAAAFYSCVWGLDPVVSDKDTIHLRANGAEHHIVTLRERPKAGMLGVHFSAPDRHAVQALHDKAKAFGATVTSAPAELPASAGGGYGFQFRTPEGHVLNISSDVARHLNTVADRSKPTKLSHVVLNSAKIEEQTNFFIDLLGFRLSDSTDMMDFVRCSNDHHSIAMSRGDGPSLNHMAYEVASMDGLMRGAGRLKGSGFNIEWGVGRHGPGDNVFTYFVEPNGFVVEYTTEVQQIDEAFYEAHDPEYWRNFPMRPCRWGMAGHPSNRLKAAFGGDISTADPEDGKRCEEIMAKTLRR
jgi:catechol-2,3-dioxygenase